MAIDARLAELLRALPGVLSTLDQSELGQVAQQLEEVTLSAGEKLWPEGQKDRAVAFVAEGELEVMKETDFPGKHIVLAVLHPGSVAGEVCAFGDNCRALTAVAVSHSRLAVLKLSSLEAIAASNPALGAKLLKALLSVAAKRLDQSYQRLTSVF